MSLHDFHDMRDAVVGFLPPSSFVSGFLPPSSSTAIPPSPAYSLRRGEQQWCPSLPFNVDKRFSDSAAVDPARSPLESPIFRRSSSCGSDRKIDGGDGMNLQQWHDETLVHSQPNPPPENYDFVVRPVIDGEIVEFFVLKRPFVDEFLETLSKKFEIVVFTAGIKEYASLVLDRLDKKGLISHRLYRDSCKEVDGRFVKDLSELGRDMKSVVIVDDNPNSYIFQPRNAIPIRAFTNDMEDGELKRLMEFFDGCDGVEDMRDAVKGFVAEEEFKELEV
nr:probable C-terminal domain small phosphatase [Ipomoea batatas]